MAIRIEEIVQRIRREIQAPGDAAPAQATETVEDDSLPAIQSRSELEFLNRSWALFDPLSEMRSHRKRLGPFVVRFKWWLRRLVLGVLDRYFEKERLFLLELVRFQNALAERSDRLLREITERTRAVAERNDLFLGALDLRLEAIEAREQMRRAMGACAAGESGRIDDGEGLLAEMAVALAGKIADRIRPFADHFDATRGVLVLGCGAGDILESLPRSAARGVEASAPLVAECRARGLAAELASLRDHLEAQAEGSLGGLIVTGIADRHPRAAWPRLVAASWRALRPGGVVVFEGLGEADAERMRWLAARQRFAIVAARAFPATHAGALEHVLVAQRGESS